MIKKNKRKFIPCPVDNYCLNWDQHNEMCLEGGCRESGYKSITKKDADFYNAKRKLESELRILQTKSRMSL